MKRIDAMRMLAEAHANDLSNPTLQQAARKLLVGVSKIGQVTDAHKRLVEAEIALAWKGGTDPEGWPEIDAEVETARENFNKVLEKVFLHEA